jgi:long-subunit acyl-CoA synthetase (AMP-forming)
MTGYFDDPEQTAEALADGWYHSGDRGSRGRTKRRRFTCGQRPRAAL